MKKLLSIAAALSVAFAAAASETNEVGTVVVVDSNHNLYPSNAVASVRAIAEMVAEAEVDRATAMAIRLDLEWLGERLDYLLKEYDKREGVVYIKGFVRMFEGAVSVDTNATAQILRFVPVNGFSAARPGYVYWKFNTWFSADVQEPPTLKYCSSLGRTNNWETITTVYGAWEDVVQVEDGEAVVYSSFLYSLF